MHRRTAEARSACLSPEEILLYLAEKSGKLLSGELRERHTTLQWLFWQVSGLGPMLGQNHHFSHYAPQTIPYAIERYQVETQRLYNVMNKTSGNPPPGWGAITTALLTIALLAMDSCPPASAYRPRQLPGALITGMKRIPYAGPATERAMQQAQSEKR